MCKNIGDLDYTDEEALNLGAHFEDLKDEGVVGGPVELHLIEKEAKDITDENAEVKSENESATEISEDR